MTKPTTVDPSHLTFLAGGGEMGARIRQMDWTRTPLGAPDTWPQSLRSTLGMLLPSKAQIILFWGPEFTVFYNDAYRAVFGAKHPRVLGQPGHQAWREIWESQLHPLLRGVVETGEAFHARDLLFELERFGFPEETYFDVSYDPVRVESGEVGAVFCIVTETTERVIGKRRLGLLRDLAARNATTRTEREALALAMETLADSPDVAFALVQVGDGQPVGSAGAEERFAAARPETVEILPLTIPAGGPPARLTIGINPRRPFDEGYRGFLNLIADQVATAVTNARAYEMERQRAEALAEIDRAKTAFFSNVSHEFRTPLTLLVGPLEDELADAAPASPARRERIETAHRNALRLLRLVNTLLDFSRIEAGRIDASYEPTDLAALTTDLASSFRSAVEKAGLALVVDCPPLPHFVYVDRDMWEKIVLNLLSNAFKFTFEGEIRVEQHWHGDHVELTVADTGVGIREEDLARVFERFHRIRDTRARTHEGTGIGLALVQELARLHGGTVSVTSQEGRGTRFTVSIQTGTDHLSSERIAVNRQLPPTRVGATSYVEEALHWLPGVRPGSTAEKIPDGVAATTASSTISSEEPSRVLIADDNADMRDYLGRILGPFYRVEFAADGGAALQRIQADPPNLVLSDVMMPTLDGFELLRAVRADHRTRTLPIVLLSARAGEEARIEGLHAGADDYLVKPFSARELLASVASQLRLARVRQDSERALRYQSQQYQTLLNQAPLGVYVVDADFRIVEVNPVAQPVFDSVPGGVVGRDFGEVIHFLWRCEFADEVVEIFRRTLETGVPYETRDRAEFRIDRCRTEHYEWRVDRITLPDGRFGLVCYFRDISEQKQIEAERLRLVQENATVTETLNNVGAIVTSDLDREKVVQAVTDAATELTTAEFGAFFYNVIDERGEAYTLYTISGVPREMFSKFPMPRNTAVFAPTFKGEGVVRSDDITQDPRYGHNAPYHGMPAGHLPVRSYLAVPVRGRGHEVLGGLFFGHSEVGRFTAHHERLAVGIASWASVALENARLYMNVQDASRIKDEFLASLSHELRTPLNAILGYSRMMRTGILPSDKKEKAIETIERNATSLTQIVEDVLDISRIVSGKIRLNVQPVDFPTIVHNAIAVIAPAADARGVRVETIVDPAAAPISGDPERLQQVLWNLLSNAVKFTPRGGRVQVRLELVHSHVELSVSDTGVGISPDFLPFVFERFRQADAGPTRERGGLGLGLSIARQLTEMHGGTIDVTSAGVGQGTTFRVKIPMMIVHPPLRDEVTRVHPRSASRVVAFEASSLHGIHVLAVDDEPDALALVSEALAAVGARVTTAQSAEEALEKLVAEAPDVVVADLGMPRTDGFAFIERLRHHDNPRLREIPAAALTAYARSEDRMHALQAGFQIHLAKPIDPAELVTTISSLARHVVVKNPEGGIS